MIEHARTRLFDRFSNAVARGAGRPTTVVLAGIFIVGWAVSGPLFGFSETWQLVVNTATTIITFLMVFVLQHSQNRDGEAVQAKLDDLIFAIASADNRFVGIEQLSTEELHELRRSVAEAAERAVQKIEKGLHSSERQAHARADKSSAPPPDKRGPRRRRPAAPVG